METRRNDVRRSLVDVYFEANGMKWTYYNDSFDLKVGDRVWVDGKLEGMLGEVVSVNYCFRIRLSDYRRVIGVADTRAKGKFHFSRQYFFTLDRNALPKEKARLWFIPPADEEEIIVGDGDGRFYSLGESIADGEIENRGKRYFDEGRVSYLCLDDTKGYAIVEGSEAYEVEFDYVDGRLGNLFCTCFCNYNCKHQVAVAMVLRQMLKEIEVNCYGDYSYNRYFAAVTKRVLFDFTINSRDSGEIIL